MTGKKEKKVRGRVEASEILPLTLHKLILSLLKAVMFIQISPTFFALSLNLTKFI